MGFFSNLFRSNSSSNDALFKKYSKADISVACKEVEKSSRVVFKETMDINDAIISKYNRVNNEDIQNELLKKYLKMSQDEINRQFLDEQLINEEIDENLEGVDKQTKEEIKEDVLKDKDENPKSKDRKAVLQEKIYKAAYSKMYDDYTYKMLKVKDTQFDNLDIAVDGKKAVEMLAYEKNLQNLELTYNKRTGKKLAQDKDIYKKKEDFNSKLNYDQKGINREVDERIARLTMLYKIREEKYREYIEVLTDDNRTPQEKYMYKKEFEEANLDLVQTLPSLDEYSKDLDTQVKIEEEIKKAGIKETSLFNEKSGKEQNGSQSRTADKLERSFMEQDKNEYRSDKETNYIVKKEIEKGNLENASEIVEMQDKESEYDRSIQEKDSKEIAKKYADKKETITNETINMGRETTNSDFIGSLQQDNANDLESLSNKELEELANEDVDINEDKEKEERIERENIKNQQEDEIVRKNRKKTNW